MGDEDEVVAEEIAVASDQPVSFTPEGDEGLLEVASKLARVAEDTGDPRVVELLKQAIEQLCGSDAIGSLLIRYDYLLKMEEGHSSALPSHIHNFK